MSRQFAGEQIQTDGVTVVARSTILVDGLTLADDPTRSPQVPQRGAPHPNIVGARVDSITLEEWIDATHAKVAVNYSNDLRGTLRPRVPDDQPGYHNISISLAPTTAEVPFFERREIRTVTDSGITNHNVWEPSYQKVPTEEMIVVIVVNVDRFDREDLSRIRAQMGVVHKFGDEQHYQFQGGNQTAMGPALWQIRYQWFAPSPLPAWPQFVGPFPDYVAPTFVLKPFEKYRVVPSSGLDVPPSIELIEKVAIYDDDGWQQLPGDLPL